MCDFIDEVACLSRCLEVVHVFCYCEMFVTVAGVEIGMLLEGCVRGCDGSIAGEKRRLCLCWLKRVS